MNKTQPKAPNNVIKLTGMLSRVSALALSVSATLFTGSLSLRYNANAQEQNNLTKGFYAQRKYWFRFESLGRRTRNNGQH